MRKKRVKWFYNQLLYSCSIILFYVLFPLASFIIFSILEFQVSWPVIAIPNRSTVYQLLLILYHQTLLDQTQEVDFFLILNLFLIIILCTSIYKHDYYEAGTDYSFIKYNSGIINITSSSTWLLVRLSICQQQLLENDRSVTPSS